jgi:hypothetical protein
MKPGIILIAVLIAGGILILRGGITGYTIIEACPQPSWVYLNNADLSNVSFVTFQEVSDFFNTTLNSVYSFTKESEEYYLAQFINGATIRECTTNLELTCGCQETSYN